MKHKLKLSLWALGILVLVMSQLFALAPVPHASAASLGVDDIIGKVRQNSVYTAFHSCLLKAGNDFAGFTTVPSETSLSISNSAWDGIDATVGWVADDAAGDGKIKCWGLAGMWYSIAGYQNTGEMYTDLGLTRTTRQITNGTTTATQERWELNRLNPGDLAKNLTTIASAKGISVSPYSKYFQSLAALEATRGCGLTLTDGATSGSNSIAVVSKTGELAYKSFGQTSQTSNNAGNVNPYQTTTSVDIKQVAAYPDLTTSVDGPTVTCKSIISYLKTTADAQKISGGLANARIANTIAAAQSAICGQIDLSAKEKADNSCEVAFGGYLKVCINQYYTNYNGSGTPTPISRSQPFDPTVVATCVEAKAKKGGYNISVDSIAAVLTDAQAQATPADTAPNRTDDPCSVLTNDIPMRWLACSILTIGADLAHTFYSIIQDLLYTPAEETFKSIGPAFRTFRLFGMALIVITGLIMIIAQATGSDFFDAYTVKKVLPKLGIALIGIALALPLLRFAVELTNNTGFLVGDFIANVDGGKNGGVAATGSNVGGAAVIGLVTTGVGVVATAIYGLSILSFILGIALSLIVGAVTLALRQLVIVVLILLAPLAIASYVLPGTEKLWKFWKNTLLTTLIMFPIVMLFLKSGVLMASIFGSMDGAFSGLMAAIVYFAPYFMIPFAFKLSGGLLGGAYGMLNERTKGARGVLRGWRQSTSKRRVADYKAGRKEGPKIFGRDLIGGAISRGASVYEGSLSMTAAGQRRYSRYLQKHRQDEAKKGVQADASYGTGDTDATAIAQHATSRKDFVDQFVAKHKGNARYGGTAEGARSAAYESMARLEGSLGADMGTRQMQIAANRGIVAADNTSYYDSDERRTDYKGLFGDVAQQVARGNISFYEGMGLIRENKNRADMSAFSSGQTIEMLQTAIDNGNNGIGYTLTDEQVERAEQYAASGTGAQQLNFGNPRVANSMSKVIDKSLRRISNGEAIAQDKETTEKQEKLIAKKAEASFKAAEMSDTPISMEQAVSDARDEVETQTYLEQYSKVANIEDNLQAAIPEVQHIVSTELLGQKVKVSDMKPKYRDLIGIKPDETELTHIEIAKRLANSGKFATLRKDYGTQEENIASKLASRKAEIDAAQNEYNI